ncbi:MAG: hypothetical protein HC945_00270, partial [Nitrosarchaeum sp.]|nr:hypothetical protein [Nitrosarchaeum sp.]
MYLNGVKVMSQATVGQVSGHSGNGGIAYANTNKRFHDTTGSGAYFQGSMHEFRAMTSLPGVEWFDQTYESIFNHAGVVTYGDEVSHIPSVRSAAVNDTVVEASDGVIINVTVEDLLGNGTVANVSATIEYPNGTRVNRTLVQAGVNASVWQYTWEDTSALGFYEVVAGYAT